MVRKSELNNPLHSKVSRTVMFNCTLLEGSEAILTLISVELH